MKKILVTGGTGFLGAAICEKLVESNHSVRILDNNFRGNLSKISKIKNKIEFVEADIRDYNVVLNATKDCNEVWHLAYINGTKYFYEIPDQVLEVGIKGTINTIDAAIESRVKKYILASTSETYNVPTHTPTNEEERLIIPDVKNPRFSYSGGKIASELLALHYAKARGLEVVIFRPHNFYGPQMGNEHVIPEIIKKLYVIKKNYDGKVVDLNIQGSGNETRSFCYISDAAEGCIIAGEKGLNGEIYHIGTQDEITISELIHLIAKEMQIKIKIVPGSLLDGSTNKRCPDINKISKIGYTPVVNLQQGLQKTISWYINYFVSEQIC